jgi:hypothetical protein
VDLRLLTLSDVLFIDAVFERVRQIGNDIIVLMFTNGISHSGAQLDYGGISIGDGFSELDIHSHEIIGNELFLTTDSLSSFDVVVFQYDKARGNLTTAASGNPVESFSFVFSPHIEV